MSARSRVGIVFPNRLSSTISAERVDAICQIAGVFVPGTVERMSDDVWQRDYDGHVTVVSRIIRTSRPLLKAAHGRSVTPRRTRIPQAFCRDVALDRTAQS